MRHCDPNFTAGSSFLSHILRTVVSESFRSWIRTKRRRAALSFGAWSCLDSGSTHILVFFPFATLLFQLFDGWGVFSWAIPVRAFAFWADGRLFVRIVTRVPWDPFMSAPFAAVAHHGNRNFRHNLPF